jgi:aminoglycoside 6'-N-acetyltransferase I
MTIRPVQPDDHAAWLQMRRALWPDCADEMHALEMDEQQGEAAAVLVVDTGSPILGGFVELSVRDRVDGALSERVGYVEGWYVAPELRGQGVGRRLIEAAERWTVAQGLTELASDVELDNEGSLRAHEALGFAETFRVVQFLKRVGPAPRS